MGQDLFGWIEVSYEDRTSWFGAVDLGPLVQRCPPAQRELFGGDDPPFPRRRDVQGVSLSRRVVTETQGRQEFLSVVPYAELRPLLPSLRETHGAYHTWDSWEIMFEILEVLAKRRGEENVRLIIWLEYWA